MLSLIALDYRFYYNEQPGLTQEDGTMFRRNFLKGSLAATTGLALGAFAQAESAAARENSDIVGTWNLNGNGFKGILTIGGVSNGSLIGSTAYTTDPLIGFWDETAKKITFIRVINPDDPTTFQIFTGYLMQNTDDGRLSLAGSFEGFQGTGAVASRVIYGWYATRRQ